MATYTLVRWKWRNYEAKNRPKHQVRRGVHVSQIPAVTVKVLANSKIMGSEPRRLSDGVGGRGGRC
jgi:hypothetical protein